MNECPCPLYTPGSRDTQDPPYSFQSPARHPGMNASFYPLRGWPGWGRGRPGPAENWIGGCPGPFPRPSKGTFFGTLRIHSLPQTQPRSPGSHGQSPTGYTQYPRATQPTARGPAPPLPIGNSSPSFPSIRRGPASALPSGALRWYSPPRLRRGGKVYYAAGQGSREEPEEAGSLWNVSVGSTRLVEARRGLAENYRRPLLIGRARSPAPPPVRGCGRGPGRSLWRAEQGARREAAAQVSGPRTRARRCRSGDPVVNSRGSGRSYGVGPA